jgi:RNA polymerase sigma factor (sigma-70 family)
MTKTAALNIRTPVNMRMCIHRVDSPTQQKRCLERIRAQDSEAFAALVNDHQKAVLGLCQSMGLRGADIEQTAMDVFANVFRAIPTFNGQSKLSTWIYRIACRTILKTRARCRKYQPVPLIHDKIESRQPMPNVIIEEKELKALVWETVAGLPERESLAIEMYYRRELSVQEIASVLECPVGTVKTLLYRARDRLKTIFAAKGIRL